MIFNTRRFSNFTMKQNENQENSNDLPFSAVWNRPAQLAKIGCFSTNACSQEMGYVLLKRTLTCFWVSFLSREIFQKNKQSFWSTQQYSNFHNKCRMRIKKISMIYHFQLFGVYQKWRENQKCFVKTLSKYLLFLLMVWNSVMQIFQQTIQQKLLVLARADKK